MSQAPGSVRPVVEAAKQAEPTATAPVPPTVPATAAPLSPWPWPLVLLAAPFTPARAVLHSAHLRFSGLLWIHLAGWLLVWGTVELVNWVGNPRTPHETLAEELIEELQQEASDSEFFVVLAFGGLGVVLVELGVLAVGGLLSGWGARDEKVRATMARGVRRGVLLSGHWWMTGMLFGAAILSLEHLSNQYYTQEVGRPRLQGSPTSENVGRLAREADEWSSQRYLNRPWYLQRQDEILGSCLSVLAAWQLWALLRAIGVGTPGFNSPRPPVCSRCGYDLTGTAPGARCPECGERVAESIGPESRPGIPWEHGAELGRWRAAWRTFAWAARDPFTFGRRMRLTSDDAHHRGFLLAVLVATAVAFPLLFEPTAVFVEKHIDWGEVLPMTIPFAAGAAGVGLGVVVLGGSLFGAIVSWLWKQRLIMAAVRAACYASPMVLVAAVLFCLELLSLRAFAYPLKAAFGLYFRLVAAALVFGQLVVLTLWFCLMNYRIVSGARYARE